MGSEILRWIHQIIKSRKCSEYLTCSTYSGPIMIKEKKIVVTYSLMDFTFCEGKKKNQ